MVNRSKINRDRHASLCLEMVAMSVRARTI